jgi:hypothetical protein
MQRDRLRLLHGLAFVALGGASIALLAIPSPAYAWAPLAHLSFSAQALANLSGVAAPARSLLQDYANEFLYGSLAADIVVGKNLASFVYHCHNWRVGFNVLRQAKPGPEKAFALGFLAHLAADTVAHNYFVPFKTVVSFHKRRTCHTYWELRYDQVMDLKMVGLARRVSDRRYRGHDELLRRTLRRASILPFGVSRGLFGSLLASARTDRFQSFSRLALARHRNLPLEADLLEETNRLAVEAILGVLTEGERCAAATADAIGGRNIRFATEVRRKLAARAGRPDLPLADAHAIASELRPVFRAAIQGKLNLPLSLDRLAA